MCYVQIDGTKLLYKWVYIARRDQSSFFQKSTH